MCNSGTTEEIPELGFICRNCGEIFTKDDGDGFRIVYLDEWIEYVSAANKKPAASAKSTTKTDVSVKKDIPASKLQIENAVLKTENNELKRQVARLQKAVRELM